MGNQIYFKIAGKKKNWTKGRTARHIFGTEPSNDYLIKILSLLSKWFQTRRFLWEFLIRSYVKLSSAVVAILVAVLKCRTQFWKRTTQESFQQSLVEIGSIRNFFWWNSHWMVLFEKYVRRFGPSTKMTPTAELSLT